MGESADGVAAGVADAGVGVLEALDDVGDDPGEVGGGEVRVGEAEEGEEARGFSLDGGFGVGGGVEEAVEEDREGLRGVGEGEDEFLEVGDCDLVSVPIADSGEGG